MPRTFAILITAGLVGWGAGAGGPSGRAQGTRPEAKVPPGESSIGMATREPTREEEKALGLPRGVRVQGQIVTSVDPGGPSAKAGIRPGDAVLRLDSNAIFSQDDISDFLRTSSPERKVIVQLRRKEKSAKEEVAVTLGRKELPETEAGRPRITWEFAGLAQLDQALAKAVKEGRPVLVGLSGAET